MANIIGSGIIEKDKRYKNTWKITCYLGEKDAKGRYKRAPKRTIHGTKADARKAVAAYKAELMGEASAADKGLTIGVYAQQFHEQREGTLPSPLSYKREALDIKYIQDLCGNVKVMELTPGMLRKIYADARKEGTYSENALHKAHAKLRQIMQAAYMDEIIMRNPVDLVKFPRPRPQEERNSLDEERVAELFRLADETNGAYATALMLMILTGMRRGEVLGLTWKYVDLENEQLFVALQYDADKDLREPKTKQSKRWISFKGYMSEKLNAWKQNQAKELALIGMQQEDGTPVFNSMNGEFIDPNNFGRWWRNFSVDHGFGQFTKDVKEIEIDGKMVQRGKGYTGLKLHELRNTQATIIQNKVNPKAAQNRLGHSQLHMTMDGYAKALSSDETRAAEEMDKVLRPTSKKESS